MSLPRLGWVVLELTGTSPISVGLWKVYTPPAHGNLTMISRQDKLALCPPPAARHLPVSFRTHAGNQPPQNRVSRRFLAVPVPLPVLAFPVDPALPLYHLDSEPTNASSCDRFLLLNLRRLHPIICDDLFPSLHRYPHFHISLALRQLPPCFHPISHLAFNIRCYPRASRVPSHPCTTTRL